MSKKSIFLSTLTLLSSSFGLAACGFLPASASTIYNGEEYWSVPEILEIKQQTDAELAACNGNETCESELRRLYWYNDLGKFVAASVAEGPLSNLAITSIDPINETIKLFFNNEDTMMGMGTTELSELYMIWSEDVSSLNFNNGHIGNGRYEPYYVTEINDGNLRDGLHLITKQIGTPNLSWATPWKEVELSIAGSEIINNTNGRLFYTTFRNPSGNSFSIADYDTCLNHPDYATGMECRMVISSNLRASYLPASVIQESTEVPTDEPTDEPTEQPTDEPTNEPTDNPTDIPTDEPITDISTDEPEPTNIDTGANTNIDTNGDIVINTSTITLGALTTPSTSTMDEAALNATIIKKPASKQFIPEELTTKQSTNKEPAIKQSITDDVETTTPAEEYIEIPLVSAPEEKQFPWWLIIFAFSGIFLVLWWFIPFSKRKKD